MGAPSGHPFFGNQYTDGGYAPGSYSYGSKLDEALSLVGASLGRSSASTDTSATAASVKGLRVPPLSASSAITVGAVLLICGVATFAYRRFKSVGASESNVEDGTVARFGVCEACGNPLAISVHAEPEQDETGDFVTCKNCSHPNRARYADEDDNDQPDLGSN